MIAMRMAAFIIMILVMGRVYRRGELDENRMEIRCGLTSTVRTDAVTNQNRNNKATYLISNKSNRL